MTWSHSCRLTTVFHTTACCMLRPSVRVASIFFYARGAWCGGRCSMNRLCRVGGLSLLMCALGALQASATPLVGDPIVRTRGGGGSIQIFGLPFTFDFGVFPIAADGCTSGQDTEFPSLTAVSCDFQNLTGSTISELNFTFGSPTSLQLTLEDTSGFFPDRFPPDGTFALAAHFGGGGIPTGFCDGDVCSGGEFGIDLVGFPDGTTAFVTSESTRTGTRQPAAPRNRPRDRGARPPAAQEIAP